MAQDNFGKEAVGLIFLTSVENPVNGPMSG